MMARNLMGGRATGVVGGKWDSGAKGPDIILTNGDKTAERDGNAAGIWDHVKGNIGKSSGKVYFEVLVDTAGVSDSTVEIILGIVDSDNAVTDFHTLTDFGYGYGQEQGRFFNSSGPSAFGDSYTSGDVIMVAVDMDANKIWFGKNGTFQASGDPGAGTNEAGLIQAGTTYFPAFSGFFDGSNSASPKVTSKFDGAELTHTVPAGFTAGWGN